MSFLDKGTKSDVQHIAAELGIKRTENLKVIESKNSILTTTNYEEEFEKEFMNSAVEERKNKAEEERRKAEDEKEKRKDELRRKEMEFDLQRM